MFTLESSEKLAMHAILKNLRSTAQHLYQEIVESLRSRLSRGTVTLDSHARDCVEHLRTDGFLVVPGYWQRDEALRMRDALERYLIEGRDCDFNNRAYLRFWDSRSYDQGVRRIYHAEELVDELKSFKNDPFVLQVAAAYYGVPLYSGVLVYQHNTGANINTRYFHVDQFGKEFKSFLYLDDVDEGNGPLAYLRGSHRRCLLRLKKQIIGNAEGSPTSFYEQDLRSVLRDEVQICAPAGTLILADVRGIHRGAPQNGRSRSVLVNYIVSHPGDLYLDK